MKRVFRGVLFCPLHRGKSGAARIGGGEHSEPVSRMIIIPYDIESQSRNADFIFIARKGDTTPLGPKGRCPLSEATQPFYTTRGGAAPLFL